MTLRVIWDESEAHDHRSSSAWWPEPGWAPSHQAAGSEDTFGADSDWEFRVCGRLARLAKPISDRLKLSLDAREAWAQRAPSPLEASSLGLCRHFDAAAASASFGNALFDTDCRSPCPSPRSATTRRGLLPFIYQFMDRCPVLPRPSLRLKAAGVYVIRADGDRLTPYLQPYAQCSLLPTHGFSCLSRKFVLQAESLHCHIGRQRVNRRCSYRGTSDTASLVLRSSCLATSIALSSANNWKLHRAMDNLKTKGGFMPGLFGGRPRKGKSPARTPTPEDEKMQGPKANSLIMRIPNGPRNHFVAMAGEFVGTFLFLFMAFAGTQVANNLASIDAPGSLQSQTLMYIALSFGFSLAVNAWIFFRISGGLFNPAVTLGLCLIGAVPFSRGGLVVISQMLGAMTSAGVVKALFPGPLSVTTTLGGGANVAQGLFIEMFLTAQLVFTIFMLAAEKHKSTFLAPVGIGLSLFIAELAGVYYTGGSLNPARSFGPCIANASFPSEHWIYWLGPCLGALLASGFFWFIKACEYQTANPGQDFDDLEASAFNPDEDITRPVVSPTAVVEPTPSREGAPRTSRDERSLSLLRPVRSSGANTVTGETNGTTEAHQKTTLGP